MSAYIEARESSRYWYGEDDKRILEVLAGRYVGANPAVPFAMRTFSHAGILQTEAGLYEMNLAEKLPDARIGQYAYVYGLVWSDDERSIDSIVEPFGPVKLFLNEEMIYRSSVVEELKPKAQAVIPLLFRKGWNRLLIEARCTVAGFGCCFGADEAKVRIMQVLAPFAEREGSAGWVYSEPVLESLVQKDGSIMDFSGTEAGDERSWLPRMRWEAEQLEMSNCERIFGTPSCRSAAYGWTSLCLPAGDAEILLEGSTRGSTQIWLDGHLVASLAEAGAFSIKATASAGSNELLVHTISSTAGWGFALSAQLEEGGPLNFQAPVHIHGYDGAWLYAGPLDPDQNLLPSDVCLTSQLFNVINGEGELAGSTYWSVDAPQTRLRPYYENAMLSNKWTTGNATNYGRWDYPLGVTMYGLLRTAKELERKDLMEYTLSHIRTCTDLYDYSMWDKEAYGFPSLNHQLVMMRMLDNCGSFGSAMLEAYGQTEDATFLRIADRIADFMLQKLERKDDGAFYRLCDGDYSANTMWADDLYMSAPFLIRYAAATGNSAPLNEAARQFLLYKSYLFMSDEALMSHVFDFKYGKATLVPWGRGNGWCLFSLSELLERLPLDHGDRPALETFFEEMCAGVAAVQSESGLWRQVLNRSDAYEEASCTAMFAYAMARGVRFGWLKRRDYYRDTALRAWQGLTGCAIDKQGNVYGVCSGSRYSYSPDYYMYDLRTVLNDNHGIGIMMLAGVEIGRMKEYMNNNRHMPMA
ncbi:rhamnogalacturonyl hydrolase YesR [Paenibacillus endophyticus]|uniref:Rhamnogalacturonyl hydrolase YesR n=1 Tax=Paenibacillus endophyticus TaxID=1294268 RepID=A0A7W5GA20_9BACL|nr:glycoside hydrolase family 88 protein [Paenibacillus endophyticus]MBB3152305.1 rhamnogalacturonyl hydrolase YesR [Paenibacillus endophyticus]